MRLPYERYIVYLCLTGHTDQEIMSNFKELELPRFGNVYLKKIREQISNLLPDWTPELQTVLCKFGRMDLKDGWINSLDLSEIHNSTEEFATAFGIFANKKKRNIVSIYLLCPDLLPDKLSEIYEKKFGSYLPIDCFDVFKKYFFDINLLNDFEWSEYIKNFDPKTRMLYERAPNRNYKYIQWKFGDEVDLNPADVSHILMTDFFFLAQDAHLMQGDNWDEKAVKFANLALSASDRATKNRRVTGKNMKLDLLNLFEEEEEIPCMDELDGEGIC